MSSFFSRIRKVFSSALSMPFDFSLNPHFVFHLRASDFSREVARANAHERRMNIDDRENGLTIASRSRQPRRAA